MADPSPRRGRRWRLSSALRAMPITASLLGNVDAVSVVTPTPLHYAIAREFLESGAHVLVEKPMTATLVGEGEALIEAARRAARVLQVGPSGALQCGRAGACSRIVTRAAIHRVGTARAVQAARHRGRTSCST